MLFSETPVAAEKSDKEEKVYESSSCKSSLKESSDGQGASSFDYRDSDTISESEEEYIRKIMSGEFSFKLFLSILS